MDIRKIKCLLGIHKFSEPLLYPFKLGSVGDIHNYWIKMGGIGLGEYMAEQSEKSYDNYNL